MHEDSIKKHEKQFLDERNRNDDNENIFVKIGNTIYSITVGVIKYAALIVVRITLGKGASDDLLNRLNKGSRVNLEKNKQNNKKIINDEKAEQVDDSQVVQNIDQETSLVNQLTDVQKIEHYINNVFCSDTQAKFSVTETIVDDKVIININKDDGECSTILEISKDDDIIIERESSHVENLDALKYALFAAYQNYLKINNEIPLVDIDDIKLINEKINNLSNNQNDVINIKRCGAEISVKLDDAGNVNFCSFIRNGNDELFPVSDVSIAKDDITSLNLMAIINDISHGAVNAYVAEYELMINEARNENEQMETINEDVIDIDIDDIEKDESVFDSMNIGIDLLSTETLDVPTICNEENIEK